MIRTPWTLLVLSLVACGGDKPAETNQPPGTTPTGGTTNAEPPRAENDLATVDEGGTTAINLAVNDLVTTHPLALGSITVVSPPQAGELTVNVDGTVSYVHDGSEGDADSFTYTIADATGLDSNLANVLITVDPVNDAPEASDDAATVDQGDTVAIDLAANDLDVDDGLDLGSIAITAAPASGTVTVNADGTVDYEHDGSLGSTDAFAYTIADESGEVSNAATVTLTVNSSNLPPLALDDGDFVVEGGSITLDLVANDADVDDGLDVGSVTLVTNPVRGSVTVYPDGTIDYDHDGSEGASDAFTYTVSDLAGQPSNVASVQLIVLPSNDAPVAVDDVRVATESAVTNLVVLTNDSDVDNALAPATVTVVSGPTYGTATTRVDGTIDYDHDGSPNPTDTLTYTVEDASGATSNVATVSITLQFVNDPPAAVNDAGVVTEGASAQFDLAANDTDPDNGLALDSIQVVTAPVRGAIVVNANGTVSYTHDGSEAGTDSFTYTIEDVSGATSNVATVSVTVNGVNDAPVAVNDSLGVSEGAVNASLAVLANDSDVDNALNLNSVVVVTPPARGSATPQADGTVRYTHNGSENPSDSFTYRVQDASGATSNVATVTVAVSPVNDAPVAVDDGPWVVPYQGGYAWESASANDTDVDSALDLYSIVIMTYPAHGWIGSTAGGDIVYYNYGDGATTDAFTYTISDTAGAVSNEATVTLAIAPPNQLPPIVNDDHARVPTETWVTINPVGNDSDAGAGLDPSSLQIITGPSYGVAVVNGDGTVDYFHDGLTNTTIDSFTYAVENSFGNLSTLATVSIDINAPSACVITFEDAWDAFGQQSNPNLAYADDGVSFTWSNTIGVSGVIGGMVNGDPGGWSIEGTNGTSAWGMWYGPHAILWDEPVFDVSMDFTRAITDQNFVVYAYRDGVQVDSVSVILSGAWDVQTVSFPGPIDEVSFSWNSSFMGLDDLRYRAPTLPCPGRIADVTARTGTYVDNTNSPYWGTKGYAFTANETFSITGAGWWLNLPVDGYVRLDVYDLAGNLLASGNTMAGRGMERWYHSELNFTFNAGQSYVAAFYTNRASSALMDRVDGSTWGYDLDGLLTVIESRASTAGGDNCPAEYPTSQNSWNPLQRLIRTPEDTQNLGYHDGTAAFVCPAWWRLPNLGEQDLAMSAVNAGDPIHFYQNIAVDIPSGCYCKWNSSWCGQPSIETYDGRMCGDFEQLHVCVEDR